LFPSHDVDDIDDVNGDALPMHDVNHHENVDEVDVNQHENRNPMVDVNEHLMVDVNPDPMDDFNEPS